MKTTTSDKYYSSNYGRFQVRSGGRSWRSWKSQSTKQRIRNNIGTVYIHVVTFESPTTARRPRSASNTAESPAIRTEGGRSRLLCRLVHQRFFATLYMRLEFCLSNPSMFDRICATGFATSFKLWIFVVQGEDTKARRSCQ